MMPHEAHEAAHRQVAQGDAQIDWPNCWLNKWLKWPLFLNFGIVDTNTHAKQYSQMTI